MWPDYRAMYMYQKAMYMYQKAMCGYHIPNLILLVRYHASYLYLSEVLYPKYSTST